MRFVATLFPVLLAPVLGLAQNPARTASAHRLSRVAEAIEITHCLKANDPDWLSDNPVLDRAKWLHVGLRHNRKTFPGEDIVFIVVLENPVKGDVFELTREDRGRHRTYTVVNNGSIDPARKGLPWVGDVLGGIWTREYIARNARKIMRGPKVWLPLKTVRRPIPLLTCTSYADQ